MSRDERLAGMSADERLAGMSPDEFVDSLSDEQRDALAALLVSKTRPNPRISSRPTRPLSRFRGQNFEKPPELLASKIVKVSSGRK